MLLLKIDLNQPSGFGVPIWVLLIIALLFVIAKNTTPESSGNSSPDAGDNSIFGNPEGQRPKRIVYFLIFLGIGAYLNFFPLPRIQSNPAFVEDPLSQLIVDLLRYVVPALGMAGCWLLDDEWFNSV